MSTRPLDVARALRHDLKYAGFTIKNIDPKAPLEEWAARSLYRDLFETRRGLGALDLVREVVGKIGAQSALDGFLKTLLAAAEALSPFREPLEAVVARASLPAESAPVAGTEARPTGNVGLPDLFALSQAVDALLAAADALLGAAKDVP